MRKVEDVIHKLYGNVPNTYLKTGVLPTQLLRWKKYVCLVNDSGQVYKPQGKFPFKSESNKEILSTMPIEMKKVVDVVFELYGDSIPKASLETGVKTAQLYRWKKYGCLVNELGQVYKPQGYFPFIKSPLP